MDKLSSPKITKMIVESHGFKFSKSLGQNFLIDQNILEQIVEGAKIESDDYVLEIGPGIGTLTREISQRAKKVIAIEIDKTLIPILSKTLSEYENVKIVNEDILKLDIKKLIDEEFEGKPVKVVANLPYYITTPIIMRFLEEHIPLKSLVIMIQKEVAQRINANPNTKEYGSLSVAVQYHCDTEIIAKASKEVFMPKPKVDSLVIRLDKREEQKYIVSDEKLFFSVVKASFSKRRKTLLNCLSTYGWHYTKDEMLKVLELAQIDPQRRGETLSIDEFVKLSEEILKLK